MMEEKQVVLSDMYRMAILDLAGVQPTRSEFDGRLWAAYDAGQADKILKEFDSGKLKVVGRDFVSAIQRIKDRVFQQARLAKSRGGLIDGTGRAG